MRTRWFIILLSPLTVLVWLPFLQVLENTSAVVKDNTALDTIFLDLYDPSNDMLIGPISSSVSLNEGNYYLITISGTWSEWYPSRWSNVCKGIPEDAPQTLSPETDNGKVGIDLEYLFASPSGYPPCNDPEVPSPWTHNHIEFSLDGGMTWFDPTPINLAYNPSHEYSYFLEGNGFPVLFRYVYSAGCCTSDNYGVLTINVHSQSCETPFFWQRDPQWISHTLRSDGICSLDFDTIGEAGCTLTSAAMLFQYYGASQTISGTEMNPANLSDCMDLKACPFNWQDGARCSNGYATNPRRTEPVDFINQLEDELNENDRPVIVGMCERGTCENQNPTTHWVLVVGGSGNQVENYTMWDPWYECGQNMRLNSRTPDWELRWMAVYNGEATCDFPLEVPECARSVIPVGLPDGSTVKHEMIPKKQLPLLTTEPITGTATLYRATEITMTVHLTAQSNVGDVTEMLVWSDTISNTIWQPFSSYVWLPFSDLVYVRFRDSEGNMSNLISDTPNPAAPDAALDSARNYLPFLVNQISRWQINHSWERHFGP